LRWERAGGTLGGRIRPAELVFTPAGGRPFYHFALLVPGNRFDAAHDWIRTRADLLPGEGGDTEFVFGFWDARAFYFHDPAGNIVELIAHEGVGEDRTATADFSASELLAISEVGLVAPEPAEAATALARGLGLERWFGDADDLCFVGRRAHTLVIARRERGWLPTGRPAEPHPVRVTFADGDDGVVELPGASVQVRTRRTPPVRLGLIGANPEAGWAARAHLPAVRAVAGIDLVAVATTRPASAQAAAERYGARHAFSDSHELIRHSDVEAVTVAVKAPAHFALVQAALEAGKHVYCEWPLAVSTDQAVTLEDLAVARGVQTAIGLQSRAGTAVRRARRLVDEGAIGRPVSATVRSAAGIGGPVTAAADAWRSDAANGTNALTVTAAHAIDTLAAVIGDLHELSATVATQFPRARIDGTDETIEVTSPDQVALSGVARDGVVVAAHIQGATRLRPGVTIEVRGTEGLIEIVAIPSLSAGRIELRIARNGGEPARAAAVEEGPVENVEAVYRDFAAAVRSGWAEAPGFAHAVRLHRLLDAIRASSEQGRRVAVQA
jgi:predicted dehydrogenase